MRQEVIVVKKGVIVLFALWLTITVVLPACSSTQSIPFSAVPRMSPEELKGKLDDASVVVLDVRVGKSWDESKTIIKGAVRENPKGDIAAWSKKYAKNKTYVLYCS